MTSWNEATPNGHYGSFLSKTFKLKKGLKWLGVAFAE
jgi:hypothetical protein